MSSSNLASRLTKKYPRSILTNKNQSRLDTTVNENLIQQSSNLLENSYQFNPSISVDFQSTTYLPILNVTTTSNQPIYESQLTFNPATGQHEQRLITCEQYYNNLNDDKEYSGCLNNFIAYDFQLSICR